MAAKLADRYPWGFAEHVLSKLPAPVGPDSIDPETDEFIPGRPLWEGGGMRFFGAQLEAMRCEARFVVDAGGVRSGKSLRGAVRILLDYLWRTNVRGIKTDEWWVVADSYEMCEEEMNHLHRMLDSLGIPHTFRSPENGSWAITFPHNECEISTKTAKDITKIASKSKRGVVIAEANQTSEGAKRACQERVSQSRGWVVLEGTFESAEKGPWYSQLWEDWQKPGAEGVSFSVPTWENLAVYPLGRDDPEIRERELNMAPDLFLERYGGQPIRRSDSVMKYADEKFHVAHRYPRLGMSFDPERPVWLFSDPGTSHAYAVAAVQFWRGARPQDMSAYVISGDYEEPIESYEANVVWVIDAIYRWGRTAADIIEECAAREWAPNVQGIVMDIAGRQRNANGPAVIEQWATHWLRLTRQQIEIITQPVPLPSGYDIHRTALLNSWPEVEAQRVWNADKRVRQVTNPDGPRLMISPDASAPLFGGMVDGQRYAGEYNLHRHRKAPDGSIIADDPVDRDNDMIKALNYGLFWYFGSAGVGHFINRRTANHAPFSVNVA